MKPLLMLPQMPKSEIYTLTVIWSAQLWCSAFGEGLSGTGPKAALFIYIAYYLNALKMPQCKH